MNDVAIKNFSRYFQLVAHKTEDDYSTLLSLVYSRLKRGHPMESLEQLLIDWAYKAKELVPSSGHLPVLRLIINFLVDKQFQGKNYWLYYLACSAICNPESLHETIFVSLQGSLISKFTSQEVDFISNVFTGMGNIVYNLTKRLGWAKAIDVINQMKASSSLILVGPNDLENLAETISSVEDATLFIQVHNTINQLWDLEHLLPLHDVLVRFHYHKQLLDMSLDIWKVAIINYTDSQKWALANICSNCIRTLNSILDSSEPLCGVFTMTCILSSVDCADVQRLVKMVVEKITKKKELVTCLFFKYFGDLFWKCNSLSSLQREIWQCLTGMVVSSQSLLDAMLDFLGFAQSSFLFLNINIAGLISSTLGDQELMKLLLFFFQSSKIKDPSLWWDTKVLGMTVSRVFAMLKSWLRYPTMMSSDVFKFSVKLLASLSLLQIEILHLPYPRVIKEYGLDSHLLSQEVSLGGFLLPSLLYSEMIVQHAMIGNYFQSECLNQALSAAVAHVCLYEEEFIQNGLLMAISVNNIDSLRRIVVEKGVDLTPLLTRIAGYMLDNFNILASIKRWCRVFNLMDFFDSCFTSSLLRRFLRLLQQQPIPLLVVASAHQVQKSVDANLVDLFDLAVDAIWRIDVSKYLDGTGIIIKSGETVEFLLNRVTASMQIHVTSQSIIPSETSLTLRCLLYSLLRCAPGVTIDKYLNNLLAANIKHPLLLAWALKSMLVASNLYDVSLLTIINAFFGDALPDISKMLPIESPISCGLFNIVMVLSRPLELPTVELALIKALVKRGGLWITYCHHILTLKDIKEEELIAAGLIELTSQNPWPFFTKLAP